MQVGVNSFLHFDLKFSQLEYIIHKVTSITESDAVKKDLCDRVELSRECDLPIFLRHWKRMSPTSETMLLPLGLNVLRVREAGKTFTSMKSERGHAQERQDLQAATGPGFYTLKGSLLELVFLCKGVGYREPSNVDVQIFLLLGFGGSPKLVAPSEANVGSSLCSSVTTQAHSIPNPCILVLFVSHHLVFFC